MSRKRLLWICSALVLGWTLAGCGGDSGSAASVATIEITSQLDTVVVIGAATQLTAVARDREGNILSVSLDWVSHNSDVVTVDASGLAHGVGPGTARIDASVASGSVAGPGGATGSIRLRVLDADVTGMQRVLGDRLLATCVAALGTPRSAVQSALSSATAGLSSGRLVDVIDGLEAIDAQAAGATDGTDRALLATITLFTDFARSLLNL